MKKKLRKPAAPAATPAAASTGRASPPVEGTPAAPPPGAYLKMPTPAVSDFEKPTPELQRALAEWFADVFLQAAPGVLEKIRAKWTGNRTRAKRIQSAMNLATSACVAYLEFCRCAAGLEKPDEETARQLAEAGVDLSGKPLADVFARDLTCPAWPWMKHGVAFLTDEQAEALEFGAESDIKALCELDEKQREGMKDCTTDEMKKRAAFGNSFFAFYSGELQKYCAETSAALSKYRAAREKVFHVRQEINFTLSRDEIKAARARLAAFLAPPPPAPAAPESTTPPAKERKARETIPPEWKRAARHFDADRFDPDKGKPETWPVDDEELWRRFKAWRNALNKGKERQDAYSVPDAAALRRARDSDRHRTG